MSIGLVLTFQTHLSLAMALISLNKVAICHILVLLKTFHNGVADNPLFGIASAGLTYGVARYSDVNRLSRGIGLYTGMLKAAPHPHR